MKIKQLANNQVVIMANGKTSFHSYNTKIATATNKTLVLHNNKWDYSNTTRKYFKQYVNRFTSFRYKDRQDWLKQMRTNPRIRKG